MDPPGLFLSGTARELTHHGRFGPCQAVKGGLDVGDRLEGVQPIAASPQLAERLRSAKEKKSDHRFGRPVELPFPISVVVPSSGPAAEDLPYQPFFLKPVQPVLHVVLTELRHRLAIRLLVAGGHQRIHCERVSLRGGELLLHQAAEDADLNRVELAGRKPPRLRVAIESRHRIGHGRIVTVAQEWSA